MKKMLERHLDLKPFRAEILLLEYCLKGYLYKFQELDRFLKSLKCVEVPI